MRRRDRDHARRAIALALALFAIGAAGEGANAQQARGTLRADSAGPPVAGAIVELLDSANAVVARTLSNAEGRFALDAPLAGDYRIRVRRVGLASTVSAPQRLRAGEVVPFDLRIASLAVELAPVLVVGRLECAADSGVSAQTAVVWEEARKALILTTLAKKQHVLSVRSRRYARDVTIKGGKITNDSSFVTFGDSSALFRSASAEDLARFGFIQRLDSATESYFAPDADVLLSHEFAATHCFQLVPGPKSDRESVGLAFTPVANDSLPDVKGTLWLDRRSAALKSLMFSYARPPVGVPDEPVIGGHIDFLRLASGWWVVNRWELRVPLDVDAHTKLVFRGGLPTPTTFYKTTRYRQVGGELLEAIQTDTLSGH